VDWVGFVGAVERLVSSCCPTISTSDMYVPSDEVKPHRSALRSGIGPNCWMEEQENRGS
jgi:hypothetical protein